MPDIGVLIKITEIFSVSMEYLISETHEEEPTEEKKRAATSKETPDRSQKRKHGMITGMSILPVWLVALIIFVSIDIPVPGGAAHGLTFAYAVPTSTIVWPVLNSVWFDRRRNYLIISIMLWSLLMAIHLSAMAGGHDLWQMYLFGVPGQMIIVLWWGMGEETLFSKRVSSPIALITLLSKTQGRGGWRSCGE